MAAGGLFPETRQSAVVLARDPDPAVRERSRARLVEAYYRAVYMHVRLRWKKQSHEAEDLTQAFFAAAVERDIFAAYDPSKSRFRTYVRACVDNLVSNAARDERRLKRGDGARHVSIDHASIEREIEGLAAETDVESVFDREWARQLFASSIEALREGLERSGRGEVFQVFSRYDLHAGDAARPTYAEIAAERGLKVTDVTNHLHAARREFRRTVLARLAELTENEEEFEEEARALGIPTKGA